MITAVYTNIENAYKDKETRIRKIKREYKEWIKIWKTNYIQLVSGMNIYVDKMIEWSKKDNEMKELYEGLIKKLRKHMKKLEV
jgi:2-hydroxy-3-keto-5-methylthiopentenyl-1-phosphate phosphatase